LAFVEVWWVNSPIIYICDHVFTGDREVSLIIHHEDGMWQLTCGQDDHSVDGATIKPVHIEHVVKDKKLADAMLGTPAGHLSQLHEDGSWLVERFDEEG
jgi:hypothetical protein